jgi:hypothetical protein
MSYSKLRVEPQIALKIRGKITWNICPFVQKLTLLGQNDEIGAKWCIILKMQG